MSAPLSLGPARPVPLSAINPVAQLSAIAVVTVVLLVSGDLLTPALVLAAELALLPAAGLGRPVDLLRRTWPLLLSAAGVAWVNVAFGADGRPDAWLDGAALAVRVIALALPGVLVLDEPTFGQDRDTWAELVALLAEQQDGDRALCLVTHDAAVVAALADDVLTVGRPAVLR